MSELYFKHGDLEPFASKVGYSREAFIEAQRRHDTYSLSTDLPGCRSLTLAAYLEVLTEAAHRECGGFLQWFGEQISAVCGDISTTESRVFNSFNR